MSRASDFARILLGESIATPEIISNVDKLWNAIITHAVSVPVVPQTAIEKYLAHLIDNTVDIPAPISRLDRILYSACRSETYYPIAYSQLEELLIECAISGKLVQTQTGKNLLDDSILSSQGFTETRDHTWFSVDAAAPNGEILWRNDGTHQGQITISFFVQYGGGRDYAGALPRFVYANASIGYIDTGNPSDYVYVNATSASGKVVDYIDWIYGTRTASTKIKYIQIEDGYEATIFEEYQRGG